ncbi:hypothetical protein [Jidongwangia harbinensis]|uniref:hypothetical protein n=1 Tax=Jidongwangia harbinensis TaxID=2878561 RepID=UPI001CD9F132|nr:hypothetical protein [Jidongwangia harbinensis]MCA2219130.1 hypothetical protein [Jidongwangia harbinensis]
MIDLSTDPPPPEPGRPGMPRRRLLLAGLCGLAGGAGGAWVTVSLSGRDRPAVAADSVAAVEQAGTPGAFADLATAGPSVTVIVGRSGRCAVTVGATVAYGSTNDGILSQGGAVSFEATGANTQPPSLERAGRSFLSLSGIEVPFSVTQTISFTTVLDGLGRGRTTFTAKYHVEGGSPVPVFFSDRTIVVTTLAGVTGG